MNEFSPIAIVGLGGIFPQAPDLETFQRNILAGKYAAKEAPPGRWTLSAADAFTPQPVLDRLYSTRACFVDETEFDLRGLRIDEGLLSGLDPLYPMVLHAGRQAFAQAVTDHLDLSRVGVVLAAIALPTEGSSAITDEILGAAFERSLFGANGNGKITSPQNARVTALPASLLARALNLGGGSCTLDAACASSLYAIKIACDQLASGRIDAALAGGVSRPDSFYTQMGFSQLRALSASGVCRPFDTRADGLVVGEGAGLFVLKRLDDAVNSGDRILGVIRGIGLSNDAAGSLLAADSEGQLRAMRAAYRQAGWRPSDVNLVECHGTGTPQGDATELASLASLWADEPATGGQCVIGSVKSNIGHLLTAAGAAGLAKVLLAMRDGQLPPTANFESAARGLAGPFRVATKAEAWIRRKDSPRRAAVSAFGFGGINAHLLVEEWAEVARSYAPVKPRLEPIAIVGMDARFGTARSLDEFAAITLGGGSAFVDRPESRWRGCEDVVSADLERAARRGAYIDSVEVEVGRYRLPPSEIPEVLPQQLLMLESVAAALDDATGARRDALRTGVMVGMGLDLNTTNFHHRWALAAQARKWAQKSVRPMSDSKLSQWIDELREQSGPALTAGRVVGALGNIIASRIAREYGFGGSSFAISSDETSGLSALDVAVSALRRGELDAAVVGAVDLAGDVRAMAARDALRPFSRRGSVRPFDAAADGPVVGEGAATLVLKRLSDAEADGDRVYAVICGVGFATGSCTDGAACESALERALAGADASPESIGLVEAHGSGHPAEDAAEAAALCSFFKHGERALGSVAGSIGQVGAASGLASLVRAALCLHHRVLPPLPGFERSAGQRWSEAGFHVPRESQHWWRNRAEGPRRACVGSMTLDGGCAQVVIEECATPAPHERGWASRPSAFGATPESLAELREFVESRDGSIWRIGQRWHDERRERADGPRVAIIAESREQLLASIADAESALRSSPDQPIRGRGGIHYSPAPLGATGQVAIVFPGSGQHFVGMGRAAALHWPKVVERLDEESERLASQMQPHLFAPYRVDWSTGWRREAMQRIAASTASAIMGQVAVGTLMYDVLGAVGIVPRSVIGYSLGETASLFATRAWRHRDEMLRRMTESPLFESELAGTCDAARRHWGLGAGEAADWCVFVVNRDADEVRHAIASLPRVYLLIVNAPGECVIGGQRQRVEQVLTAMGCDAVEVVGASTVHCEIAREVAEAYRELHLLETIEPDDIRVYSAANAAACAVNRESAADSILEQALHGFDFPRLIEQAYADGVRMFIEAGPGASCTRMIQRILGGRPLVARSVCVEGESEALSVLQAVGALYAEGAVPNFDALYESGHRRHPEAEVCRRGHREHRESDSVENSKSGVRRIAVLTGARAAAPRLPEWWRCEDEVHVVEAPVARRRYELIEAATDAMGATAGAHEAYLRFSREAMAGLGEGLALEARLVAAVGASGTSVRLQPARLLRRDVAFDREMCMEFAIGSASRVLGARFVEVDTYPLRVRLPDEPLMLVDRILQVEGEKCSLGGGRIVTEHDVWPDAWYLDGGHAPVCITVEAGQADLFLCAYLGIDLAVKGKRAYRLLDARITFHRELPRPGEVPRYDIRIDRFVRQGETYMFFFSFEGTIDGEPLLTMTDGCAGFFTEQEIAESGGIVRTAADRAPQPGRRIEDWRALAPMAAESYDAAQVDGLRRGDLEACFGPAFAGRGLARSLHLPGGRMRLVHRVTELDPVGGRFGLGAIRAEADIQPDDWFLTCHFVDDMVMPGTLMYECCGHALRILLMRMGWVSEKEGAYWGPVIGSASKLRCRGPVTAATRVVRYELEVREIGYDPSPYAIADALMYADGRPIVRIEGVTLRLNGVTREKIEAAWVDAPAARAAVVPIGDVPVPRGTKAAIFDRDRILAFAVGQPSEAFGERYAVFDSTRRIARLPGPPYSFMDRVTEIHAEAWQLAPGGWIESQYEVPRDAWYFAANRQAVMPYAVLVEIALQPCGWLAAYLGSALCSEEDLSFRNLDGHAVVHESIGPDAGMLTVRVRITRVSRAGGMIIEHFDFQVWRGGRLVYEGDTVFGFFTAQALSQQAGIRDSGQRRYVPAADEIARGRRIELPDVAPMCPNDHTVKHWEGAALPSRALRMIDSVEVYIPDGGPKGLGFLRGIKQVDPDEWFFAAHFYQDPVCPGSLGLESMLQLLKVAAREHWGEDFARTHSFEAMASGIRHTWMYRGQILPTSELIEIEAVITEVIEGDKLAIVADGLLLVDGMAIYAMDDFAVRMIPLH